MAARLQIPATILLVVSGIGLALIPGLPPVELAPELVLLLLLPPLIYSAAVAMSWREFRFNLRPITLLAFGCVIFTTCAVAAAVHYLLSWQWGAAFIVGAIVAPPDVVAPLAIARRLNTGMAHINDSSVNDEPHVPFGGVKQSGLGREGSSHGMDEYLEMKYLCVGDILK